MRKIMSLIIFVMVFGIGYYTNIWLSSASQDIRMKDILAQLSEINEKLTDDRKRIDRIEEQLEKWATLYDIANCESKLNHYATGDGGKANGILQFHKPTFYWLSAKAKFQGDYYNKRDQIILGLWALQHDYGYLWSCFKKERRKKDEHNG